MKIIFLAAYSILSLCTVLFLELNHNTHAGWFLFAAWAAGFLWLWHNVFRGKAVWKRAGGWLLFLAVTVLIVFVSRPPVRPVPAVRGKSPAPSSVIDTAGGKVQGVWNEAHTVEIYTGIPYAAPPVGELRWRPPMDPASWEGVRICDHFAPMSMQETNPEFISSLARIIGYHDYTISLSDQYRPPVSEDSLYLNIWKPGGDVKDLPVIVYIHGGSLQTGQPWYDDYSGETFAANGVVTVNMGYRLGIFGFLAEDSLLAEDSTTGNYGLLDQIKALEWVRDNIRAFGGDPDNVTLIGESAGAVCVDALCVSPLAEGLFRRAVLESSTVSAVTPPHSYRSLDEALSSGRKILARYGCDTIDALRRLPAETIVNEMASQHHITPDGYVLPDDPYILRRRGIHNEEALLHGFNKEESAPFLLFSRTTLANYADKVRAYFGAYADDVLRLYPAQTDAEAAEHWAEIYSTVFFSYSHSCLNRLSADAEPVYAYLFTKTNKRLSCWHSGELVYAFGRIPARSSLYDDSDRALSETMMRFWLAFAKTGDPNAEGLPRWETNTGSDRLMEFGDTVRSVEDPYLPLYGILDSLQGFSAQ